MTDFLARMNANESRAKLTELTQRTRRIQNDLQRQLSAAQSFADPDLSPEGLGRRREQMAVQARERASRELEQVAAEQRQHAARIKAWAEAKRPVIADDPVQLHRVSLAWDRARAMLDNGRSIRQVLADATDPSMVLAVREWGPDYLRATTPQPSGLAGYQAEEPDFTGLVRSADERLAELHGGDVAAAVQMLRDVDVAEAGFGARSRHIGQQVAGGPHDPLAAAIEAHYAEQQAAAGWQDDGGDAASAGGDAA